MLRVVVLCLLVCTSFAVRRVIIDTDSGSDDLIAISILMQKHLRGEIKIEGITTVHGMLPARHGAEIMLRLTQTLNIWDIEIHVGCEGRFIPNTGHYFEEAEWWREMESLLFAEGDIIGLKPLSNASHIAPEPADEYLIKKAHQCMNGSCTFLTLGPLTNVALALTKDGSFLKRMRNIVYMGGCVNVPGNAPNNVSEWNFYADAYAATMFMKHVTGDVNVHMCGLEVANVEALTEEEEDQLEHLVSGNALGRYIQIIMSNISVDSSVFDPIAASYIIAPSMYSFQLIPLVVETQPPNEGRLVAASHQEVTNNVYVADHLVQMSYFEFLSGIITATL